MTGKTRNDSCVTSFGSDPEQSESYKLSHSDELNTDLPEISNMRLFFLYLTDEQIAAVNKAGKVPNNAKFVPKTNGSGYRLHNNFFGVLAGTQTIPEGYELKRNWLGFTIVVPKDTQGLFIRSNKEGA